MSIGLEKDRYYEQHYHMYGECVESVQAASIIFLSAGTRRVFPIEIFLSRDVVPVSPMVIVFQYIVHLFVLVLLVLGLWLAAWLVLIGRCS